MVPSVSGAGVVRCTRANTTVLCFVLCALVLCAAMKMEQEGVINKIIAQKRRDCKDRGNDPRPSSAVSTPGFQITPTAIH